MEGEKSSKGKPCGNREVRRGTRGERLKRKGICKGGAKKTLKEWAIQK